jgi:hypothetical protein
LAVRASALLLQQGSGNQTRSLSLAAIWERAVGPDVVSRNGVYSANTTAKTAVTADHR